MKITRRKALQSLAAGASAALAMPVAARQPIPTDDEPGFDPDVEEANLWQVAEDALDRCAVDCVLDPSLRGGAARSRLRSALEAAIDAGTWHRLRPVVEEYVRTGANIAAILAYTPDVAARIDEGVASLAIKLVQSNHRVVKLRVLREQRRLGIRI